MRESKSVQALFLVALLSFAIMLTVGGFHLSRWFNWKLGYGDMAEETVKQLVKPECLKATKND